MYFSATFVSKRVHNGGCVPMGPILLRRLRLLSRIITTHVTFVSERYHMFVH
jgi:hypothetical protein